MKNVIDNSETELGNLTFFRRESKDFVYESSINFFTEIVEYIYHWKGNFISFPTVYIIYWSDQR